MQIKINEYFEQCKGEILKNDDGKPVLNKYGEPVIINFETPTVAGLTYFLGFKSRDAFSEYAKRQEFSDTITRARLWLEKYVESRLYDRDGARGAEFSLKYNFKWNENQCEAEREEKEFELPARVFGKEWVDVNRSINKREFTQYDFQGGRGSLKSSYVGLKIIELIKQNDNFCALAVRQLKDNLRDSVYAQITWAIDELGLAEEFHCTVSPMQIKRKSTGQMIYFRGADDPSKIKSIKPPKGMYIGVVWIEEADQLHGAEALRNILQSAFRGGDDGLLFRTYNVPISQQHFINKEARETNDKRFIHHSHFKNAPPEWLGKRFWEDAEALKQSNERAYRHEYDGEATGTGATIFENVKVNEPITNEQIAQFDRALYGIDWGYYPDPFAFVEAHYDAARRTLYIFGERVYWKSSNANSAEELKNYKNVTITADSAEPKSIGDFRAYDFSIFPAEKGPDSVKYSYKWLQSLNAIIIDKKRCPHATEEFLTAEYERSKDGEIISGYPDVNNHLIDAVRYATNHIWRRKGQ